MVYNWREEIRALRFLSEQGQNRVQFAHHIHRRRVVHLPVTAIDCEISQISKHVSISVGIILDQNEYHYREICWRMAPTT